MINYIKKLFGIKPPIDFKKLIEEGAKIMDVRSKDEFLTGSIKGAINIPLNSINQNLKYLGDKEAPIITCCASGMRSSLAKDVLGAFGYINVYNGGGWHSLKNKLQ